MANASRCGAVGATAFVVVGIGFDQIDDFQRAAASRFMFVARADEIVDFHACPPK
jgi:hypothetical protein